MIGNDVVDLTDAETQPGARHPRFDTRVFTTSERDAIAAGDAGERVRWLLWAAKEAAFKAARKADAATVFSPAHFEVDLEAGVVWYAGERFVIVVDGTEEYVHVVAEAGSHGLGGRMRAAVGEMRQGRTPGVESAAGGRRCSAAPQHEQVAPAAVRGLAVGMLAHELTAGAGDLRIVTLGRIPHVERDGETLAVDLSLSHHGRFVACAFSGVGRAVPGPPRRRQISGIAEAP